jgi:predicted ester cyclase
MSETSISAAASHRKELSLSADDILTICAISIVAGILTNILHEGVGHGLVALLTGAKSGVLTTVAWSSAFDSRLVAAGGKTTDVAGDEQMMVGMYEVMPDLHLTIKDMIAEGDKVVCRNIWRWTDPSDKKMQFHGFVLWRFEGDKIAERWATVTSPAEGISWNAGEASKSVEKPAS